MSRPLPRITRQYRLGDDFAVDIPAELAFPDGDQELEIEAVGDTRVIRPKREPISIDEFNRRLDEAYAAGATGLSDEAFSRPEWPEHRSPK